MPELPKLETAVMALGVVAAADQVIRGLRDENEDGRGDANAHYVKAAVAAAIAIGAYEKMRYDERHQDHQDDPESHHRPHHRRHSDSYHPAGDALVLRRSIRHDKEDDSPRHARDLAIEALGLYAFGRQAMGHKEHQILKLVAEGLGATALARELQDRK